MRAEMWIKHDMRSRTDGKMRWFLKRTGLEGYGAFWATIEVLHYQNNNELPLSGPEFEGIADDLILDPKHYLEILELGVEAGLFSRNESHLWQPRMKRDEGCRRVLQEASKASMSAGGRVGGIISGLKRRGANPEEIQKVIEGYRSQASSLEALEGVEHRIEENRIDINKNNSILIRAPLSAKPPRVKKETKNFAPGINLTTEGHESIIQEFGQESFDYHLKVCSDWIAESGKKKTDCAAFMRNWIRRSLAERRGFYYPKKNTNGFEPHCAATTGQKNLEYLKQKGYIDGTENFDEMFKLDFTGQKRPVIELTGRGDVVSNPRKN